MVMEVINQGSLLHVLMKASIGPCLTHVSSFHGD